MTITLTPGQKAWLDVHVERGDFASIEEAVRQLLDERIAEREVEEKDDLAWAKPFVEEALVAAERGEILPLDEHKARNAARLSAMKNG